MKQSILKLQNGVFNLSSDDGISTDLTKKMLAVLQVVCGTPSLSTEEVGVSLSMSKNAVSKHTSKLHKCHLVNTYKGKWEPSNFGDLLCEVAMDLGKRDSVWDPAVHSTSVIFNLGEVRG